MIPYWAPGSYERSDVELMAEKKESTSIRTLDVLLSVEHAYVDLGQQTQKRKDIPGPGK